MIHRIAFAGFRHSHIFSLWRLAMANHACEIVAACESDPDTRRQLQSRDMAVTHEDFTRMLDESECTAVAIGDIYARRGQMAIVALKAGKHVISDKPICTDPVELAEIERLSREKALAVGCQFDLMENGAIRRLRAIIASDRIGRPCTITISAQHPLRFSSRPAWYFEAGQHGGTINDIGIHIFQLLPWLTDSPWSRLLSAREWNAKAVAAPHFKDCAQFHGLLENGASCFSDVSYLAPDSAGYGLQNYWRITAHGTRGMAEVSLAKPDVLVACDEDAVPVFEPPLLDPPFDYLSDFFAEIEGSPSVDGLTTARVLTASRRALEAREHARQS